MPAYRFAIAVGFYLILAVSPALAQTYDFDDELDIGWEHLDPFEKGSPGIIVSVDPEDGAIDATFDNFSLTAEGTETNGSPPEILDTEVTANTIRVLFWPRWCQRRIPAQVSTDLQSWLEVVFPHHNKPATAKRKAGAVFRLHPLLKDFCLWCSLFGSATVSGSTKYCWQHLCYGMELATIVTVTSVAVITASAATTVAASAATSTSTAATTTVAAASATTAA